MRKNEAVIFGCSGPKKKFQLKGFRLTGNNLNAHFKQWFSALLHLKITKFLRRVSLKLTIYKRSEA